MTAIRVERAGFLTTVQDSGRRGHAHLGIGLSGAADAIALRVGNRLVGNPPDAAALEMTLVGGTFAFEGDAIVAVCGADPGARCGGLALPPWRAHRLRDGRAVACGPLASGARAYLCIRGGIAVDPVLGSRATHLAARFGGLDGRPLRAGDRLAIGPAPARDPLGVTVDPRAIPGYATDAPLRATDGAQRGWFDPRAIETFFGTVWTASDASDRMGIRLDGASVLSAPLPELVTEGVAPGAVQVPGSGRPIVLLVEHPTTGGYPKIAHLVAADLARAGQLRPRDGVRFAPVTLAEARRALVEQEEALRAIGT